MDTDNGKRKEPSGADYHMNVGPGHSQLHDDSLDSMGKRHKPGTHAGKQDMHPMSVSQAPPYHFDTGAMRAQQRSSVVVTPVSMGNDMSANKQHRLPMRVQTPSHVQVVPMNQPTSSGPSVVVKPVGLRPADAGGMATGGTHHGAAGLGQGQNQGRPNVQPMAGTAQPKRRRRSRRGGKSSRTEYWTSEKERMREKRKPKKYSCDRCPQKFTRPSHLKVHMRSHTGERPFACATCKKTFAHKGNLTTHERTHSTSRPYACDKCTRSFNDLGMLEKHRRVHEGRKPFECDVPGCQAVFSQASTLTRHKVTHLPVKPFACPNPGCDKKYVRKYSLKNHVAYHCHYAPAHERKTGNAPPPLLHPRGHITSAVDMNGNDQKQMMASGKVMGPTISWPRARPRGPTHVMPMALTVGHPQTVVSSVAPPIGVSATMAAVGHSVSSHPVPVPPPPRARISQVTPMGSQGQDQRDRGPLGMPSAPGDHPPPPIITAVAAPTTQGQDQHQQQHQQLPQNVHGVQVSSASGLLRPVVVNNAGRQQHTQHTQHAQDVGVDVDSQAQSGGQGASDAGGWGMSHHSHHPQLPVHSHSLAHQHDQHAQHDQHSQQHDQQHATHDQHSQQHDHDQHSQHGPHGHGQHSAEHSVQQGGDQGGGVSPDAPDPSDTGDAHDSQHKTHETLAGHAGPLSQHPHDASQLQDAQAVQNTHGKDKEAVVLVMDREKTADDDQGAVHDQ